MSDQITLSIVGTGNVALRLGQTFRRKGYVIQDLYGRNKHKAHSLASLLESKSVDSLDELGGDLIIVCVSDNAIAETVKLFKMNQKVVYTSGPVHLNACGRTQNTGVLYPLQTLQTSHDIYTNEIPFLVEAQHTELLQLILTFAKNISPLVYEVSSDQRLRYHLAAIWMNNFTNHMVYLSKKMLEDHGLDFNLLKPLLVETAEKMKHADPKEAQTGPARRNDKETMELHQSLLSGIPLELYQILSKSISRTY